MPILDWLEAAGRFAHFAFRALPATFGAVRRPRELLRQDHHVYVGAGPLCAVAGLALGVVVWLHLHGVLARFGPGYTRLLPQALALAVVLEFGPLGAGLIVAGRSGASLGAELGSMRLTEQIDALEALGQSPLAALVGPRVLACVLALPLLAVATDTLAVAGSFAAEAVGGTMTWREYGNQCLAALRVGDVLPATLKTMAFGYAVGVTGCYCGMRASGGTEGVGRAATRGVVGSIFLVVVSDVVLVRLTQLLA